MNGHKLWYLVRITMFLIILPYRILIRIIHYTEPIEYYVSNYDYKVELLYTRVTFRLPTITGDELYIPHDLKTFHLVHSN